MGHTKRRHCSVRKAARTGDRRPSHARMRAAQQQARVRGTHEVLRARLEGARACISAEQHRSNQHKHHGRRSQHHRSRSLCPLAGGRLLLLHCGSDLFLCKQKSIFVFQLKKSFRFAAKAVQSSLPFPSALRREEEESNLIGRAIPQRGQRPGWQGRRNGLE